jgi:GNAT superfamily N-acetyltransferase
MQIRKGQKSDIPSVMELVRELAIYEKAEDQVSNTIEQMEIDGFGENPIFHFIVAEVDGKVVGMSLYYYRYSTWKGKRLYLEDYIITESHRGTGLGKLLFEATIKLGKETDCTGMMWQVLDWNEPAINFYKKYNARFDEEWYNCHLDF